MIYFWRILLVLFEGVWRSAFGKSGFDLPLLKNRAILHLIGGLGIFLFFWLANNMSWIWSLYIVCIIQGLEWSLGHGSCFDIGQGGQPDEKMKERYRKTLGWGICSRIFKKEEWYSPSFDASLFCLRYTLPLLLLLPVLNPLSLLAGSSGAFVYGVYRNTPSFQSKHNTLVDNEFVLGVLIGFALCFG